MGCNGSKQQAQAAAANNKEASSAPPAAEKQPLQSEYKIALERTADEQTLGLSITTDPTGVISVVAVKEEGMVPDFIKANANNTEQHVVKGDRIVAVNDVSGDAEKMKDELRKKLVVLTMQREQPQTAAADQQAAPTAQPESAAEPETAEKKEEDVKEPAVAVPAEETPAAVVDAAAPAEVVAPAEEPAATTDDATDAAVEAAAENPAETPAMATEDAAAAAPALEGEVAVLQDAEVVVDEKEERLCRLAMC